MKNWHSQLLSLHVIVTGFMLEIRFVEPGICPIATLYSLAAAHKGGGCKQGAIIFYGNRVIPL